jgi:hypothetical protein
MSSEKENISLDRLQHFGTSDMIGRYLPVKLFQQEMNPVGAGTGTACKQCVDPDVDKTTPKKRKVLSDISSNIQDSIEESKAMGGSFDFVSVCTQPPKGLIGYVRY